MSNLEGFARAYRKHKIKAEQEARLFLVAPSFSVTMLNRIKWIDIPISLYAVQCIEFEDEKGEVYPVYTEVRPPAVQEAPETYSLDVHYEYITDAASRGLAQKVVAEIESWDSERVLVKAIKYCISIQCSGSLLAYMEPRRRYSLISSWDAEGKWTGLRIDSKSDWEEEVRPLVRASFERLAGKSGQ